MLIWLSQVERERDDSIKVKTVLRKLRNVKVLNLIYEKKSEQILDLAVESPSYILPLIKKRVEQRLKVLELQKKEYFSPKWRLTMENNFYKALDVKSNSIKIREKKHLVNKNLIQELRKIEEKCLLGMPVKIKKSIPKLLGLE